MRNIAEIIRAAPVAAIIPHNQNQTKRIPVVANSSDEIFDEFLRP